MSKERRISHFSQVTYIGLSLKKASRIFHTQANHPEREVICVFGNNGIMETSTFNPHFYREHRLKATDVFIRGMTKAERVFIRRSPNHHYRS